MTTITMTEILDDLRAADEITRRFERRYWLSSADFYDLYTQGVLDTGEHLEDFNTWAAFYEIKCDREQDLAQLSGERLRHLRDAVETGETIQLSVPEPALTLVPA